jgi:hypothetical protein
MNIINRHNYETFFLLYIDNELSTVERKAVDEFVKANPDLEEELIMLQQSIVQPDAVVFDGKKSLLKTDLIPTAMQEKLLMHLDNELATAQQNEIDGIIKTDALVEKEWSILQQTKLLPGPAIVFEDKESLYRKTPGRLVSVQWWRVAVAAVVIGFGVWGGLSYLKTGNDLNKIGTAGNSESKPAADTVELAANQITAPVVSPKNQKEAIAVVPVITKKTSNTKTIPSTVEMVEPPLIARDIVDNSTIEKTNNLPKPYSDNLNSVGSNKTITANVTPEKQQATIVSAANNGDVKNNGQDAASHFATTASFADNDKENDNHIFLMDEERVKKTKLGGMIRKVKRVLERNTNIKTGGNTIRVANLEFAIQ